MFIHLFIQPTLIFIVCILKAKQKSINLYDEFMFKCEL